MSPTFCQEVRAINGAAEREKRGRGRPPKHGAYSGSALVVVQKEKRVMIDGLLAGTEVAIGPADAIPLNLLARNLAKIEVIDRYLIVNGLFEGDGTPRPILKMYWQAVNSAARMCDQLGLTPSSRMRLGLQYVHAKDIAAGIEEAKDSTSGKEEV